MPNVKQTLFSYGRAAAGLRIAPERLPLVVGHRGFAARAPENTLAAFKMAAAHGISAVELDIQLSADGLPVVIHDADVHRVSGVDATVRSLSAADLAAIDVGRYFGAQFAGEGVPTLAAVVESMPADTFFDIELKAHDKQAQDLAHAAVEWITRLGLQGRCIVSSFYPGALRACRRLAPHVPRAIIYSRHKEVPWVLRGGLGAWIGGAQVYKPHYPQARAALCSRAAVLTWTVNDEATALRALHAGAAGLIGDDPLMLQAAVRRFREAAEE